ncbi:MAG: hypothetical protein AAFO07_20115 [Bacteroidota bacterium]
MQQTFTTEQLILFIYNELSTKDTMALRKAIQRSPELKKQYKELVAAQRQLPKVKFKASTGVLNRIKSYSKSTAFEEQC